MSIPRTPNDVRLLCVVLIIGSLAMGVVIGAKVFS